MHSLFLLKLYNLANPQCGQTTIESRALWNASKNSSAVGLSDGLSFPATKVLSNKSLISFVVISSNLLVKPYEDVLEVPCLKI